MRIGRYLPLGRMVRAIPETVRNTSLATLPGLLSALAVSVLVGLWLGIWAEWNSARTASEKASREDLGNLARVLAEHTGRTIDGADRTLRFVRREYLTKGPTLNLKEWAVIDGLIDQAYGQVAIIGVDGHLIQSSVRSVASGAPIDLSDREHFRVHREGATDHIFISRPVVGRVSGKRTVQITRRIEEPDGKFGGVVVLTLSTDYLGRLYGSVDLGSSEAGLITLIGTDGIVRAERSANGIGEELGRDESSSPLFKAAQATAEGTVWTVGARDGIRRLWAFQRVEPYGLIVAVGRHESDVYASGEFGRANVVLAGLMLSVVVLALTQAAMRRAGKQARSIAQLQESELKASEASMSKSRFIASVSHELRTPLNGILGYAQLVQDESSEQDVREYADIIYRSATHLHELVNTILDLSSIEAGDLRLQIGTVDLREALAQIHSIHRVSAERKGLLMELIIDPSCPPTVQTDRMRFLQIVGNLIHNAVKFTDAGKITISAARTASGIDVSVADSGPGIAPERIDRIFSEECGTADDFSHPLRGAGLGLPLAKQISELIGGSLDFDRAYHPGAKLILSIPVGTRPAEA